MKKKNVFSPIRRKRGWVLFLVGLGIAILFGLGVRSVFNSKALDHWLKKQIVSQGLADKISYHGIRLSFHRSSLPKVGVYFDQIQLRMGGGCGASELKLEDIYLPLSTISLIQSRLKLGTVIANRGELVVNSCIEPKGPTNQKQEAFDEGLVDPSNKVGKVEALDSLKNEDLNGVEASVPQGKDHKDSKLPKPAPFDKISKYFQKSWQNDWDRWSKKVSGFRIGELEVFDKKTQRRWMTANKAKVFLDDPGVLSIESKLKLEDFVFGGIPVRPFEVELSFSEEEARFGVEGLFQEGTFKAFWTSRWLKDTYSWNLNIRDFPLRGIATTYKYWLQKDVPLDLKLVWLSCQANQEGTLSAWMETPINLSSCVAYGNSGKLKLNKVSIDPKSREFVEPFSLGLENLSLEHFAQIFHKMGPMGVFNSLGRIFGSFTIKNTREFSGHFELKNMELAFSNRGIHGKQKVNRVVSAVELKEGRLSGIVSHIELDDGEVVGDMSYNLDPKLQSGLMQVKMKRVSFNPSIQSLLIGGEMAPLEFYGQVKLEHGEVVDWRGGIGASKLSGQSWSLEGLKMNSRWTAGKLLGQLNIRKIQIEEGHNYLPLMRPLFLDERHMDDGIDWSGLKADVVLENEGGQWKNLSVTAEPHNASLISKGQWKRDGDISGIIGMKLKGLPHLKWTLSGVWNDLRVLPSYSMIELLANRAKKKLKGGAIVEKVWFEKLVKRRAGAIESVAPPQKSN